MRTLLFFFALGLALPACAKDPPPRATDEKAFVAQALERIRSGDRAGWNALLLSRDEYKSHCPTLLRKNPPGWLDEHMQRRENPKKGALHRCRKIASDAPLKVLIKRRGGEVSKSIRMPECSGLTALDPLRLIVENKDGARFSVRLDAIRHDATGQYLPSGYAECHRGLYAAYGCERLEKMLEKAGGPGRSFSSFTCHQTLKAEPKEKAEPTRRCLEAAKDVDAARACWAPRPLR